VAAPSPLAAQTPAPAPAVAVAAATGAGGRAASSLLTANEPAASLKDGKVIRAFRVRSSPPVLDGRLDEEVWTLAETGTGLVQRDPDNGKPMTERTAIQVLYDDKYLYIGLTCFDSNPQAIAAGLGRRDELPPTDYVTLSFDPRHDHQNAYAFQTNPSGWQGDYTYYNDDRYDLDYNAVWEVRTRITADGWTAEARIPLSQMRFTASPDGQIWGFNLQRRIRRKSESGTWVAKPRGYRGEVSLFGHILFDETLPSLRRLDLLPYALARRDRRATGPDDQRAALGLDVRYGVGTAATLSATVNPDFGQVEQDPAVLNLTVFETFFPEKRPFFLEDSRTFVPPYSQFQLFHSRRIGRAPGRLPIPTGSRVVSPAEETTILGAAKITGKHRTWTYGVLSALTDEEFADVDLAGGLRSRVAVEPSTSYNVARVQRDVLNGSSNIGAIGTAVVRDKTGDAFTGGFDYNLRWDRNRSGVNGHWVFTHAPGTGGVKTSGGGVTDVTLVRKHWNTSAHVDHLGRDFRVNDIGFLRTRANRSQIEGSAGVEQPDPWRTFRRTTLTVGFAEGWNDERLVFGRAATLSGLAQFRNFWTVTAGATRDFERLDDLDTRGGPPILRSPALTTTVGITSDTRKSWKLTVNVDRRAADDGSHSRAAAVTLSQQPSSRLLLSASTRYERGTEAAQWIRNLDTDGDGSLDNVYGTLRRNVVDITLRGTYSVYRDLTFQAYLQPFVAVGDYSDTRRLTRPSGFEFSPVTLQTDPDFNTKSLRGNVVARWEYARGSTMFFVWDLSRSDPRRPGVFEAFRDLGDVFGGNANHVFMVKVSYWLTR
jgi:hypothetical protein